MYRRQIVFSNAHFGHYGISLIQLYLLLCMDKNNFLTFPCNVLRVYNLQFQTFLMKEEMKRKLLPSLFSLSFHLLWGFFTVYLFMIICSDPLCFAKKKNLITKDSMYHWYHALR